MRWYKRVFAISGAVAADIVEKCPDIRPVVVYNGVPLDQVVPREDYRYDDFRLIHIGRLLHEVKGQDILLRALRLLIRDHGFDNLRVDFVGAGPSLQYLKSLAVEFGLDKHCSFLGEHPREFIYENLKNYHVLVQPSLSEGFGLTIVEAMAAKIPVVISDLDAPMELIRSGEYGRFFKRGDVAACAQRILETMRTYGQEEEKNRLELARRWAVAQFEVKTTATNYLRQYADIVPAKLQRTG
jgi:glycosyltransferase involved in cell wall biosynthesis